MEGGETTCDEGLMMGLVLSSAQSSLLTPDTISSHHLPLVPGLVLYGNMERLGVINRDTPLYDCLLFFICTSSYVRLKGASFEGEEQKRKVPRTGASG